MAYNNPFMDHGYHPGPSRHGGHFRSRLDDGRHRPRSNFHPGPPHHLGRLDPSDEPRRDRNKFGSKRETEGDFHAEASKRFKPDEGRPRVKHNDPRLRLEPPLPIPVPSHSGGDSPGIPASLKPVPAERPAVAAVAEAWLCRLCNNDKPFKSEKDFILHLTFIHYQDRIVKRIKPPFECLKCGYTPTDCDTDSQKCDDLLMHYGCLEGVSMEYYRKECAHIPIPDRQSPLGGRSSARPPAFVCDICKASHENERLFVRHISLRHFARDLCDELPKTVPFKCPYIDCGQEKTNLHNLMMHYGWEHNVSLELYHKRARGGEILRRERKLSHPISEPSIEPPPTASTELGPNSAEQAAANRSALSPASQSPRLDSSCAKIPPRHTPTHPKKTSPLACQFCREKITFANQKSMKYHVMLSHFFPKLSKVGPYKCVRCEGTFSERNLYARHFTESHYETYIIDFQERRKRAIKGTKPSEDSGAPTRISKPIQTSSPSSLEEVVAPSSPGPNCSDNLQPARVRKTVHNVSSARQRLVQNWEKSSFDVHKNKIEDLQAELETIKDTHRHALKSKAGEFERWIKQKENALEDEEKTRKAVEDKLEQATVDMVDLQKQLEQAQTNCQNLETIVADKLGVNSRLTKEKKLLERNLRSAEEDITQTKSDLEATKELLDGRSESLKTAEATLAEKEEELKEIGSTKDREMADMEKKRARMEKQVESHKAKVEKLTEEKKERVRADKEEAKKRKESEKDLQEQLAKLTRENRQLSLKSAQEKQAESKTMGKVEEITQLLKNTESQVELLETERNVLLDSLERLQRILNDFENIVDEKNDKIKELNGRLEDNETILEESLQKIKDQKGIEREKKDLSRQVKQLQSTLKDWESRQFNNLKLIGSLESENSEIKAKLKRFEENKSGNEEELSEMRSKLDDKEKNLKTLRHQVNELEKDKAKMEARMTSKSDEIFSLQNRNDALDVQVRDLEREVRDSVGKGAGSPASVDDLREVVTNQEGELKHLRLTLMKVKTQYNEQRQETLRLKGEIDNSSRRNETFESDFSELVTQHETVKTALKDNHQRLVSNSKELKQLRQESNRPGTSVVGGFVLKQELNDEIPELPEFAPIPDSSAHCVDTANSIVFPVPALVEAIKLEPGNSSPSHTISRSSSLVELSPPRGPSSTLPRHDLVHQDLRSFFPEDEDPLPPLEFVPDPTPANMLPPVAKSTGSSGRGRKKKKPNPSLEDVTETFEGRDDIVCGICSEYDPPLPPVEPVGSKKKPSAYTTEWVGCDCARWFHMQCTKKTRLSKQFSCRSVKMKCIKP